MTLTPIHEEVGVQYVWQIYEQHTNTSYNNFLICFLNEENQPLLYSIENDFVVAKKRLRDYKNLNEI